MRSKILLYGSLVIAMTSIGCSFQASHESAGGMLVVEDSLVDGNAKCALYARNRTIDEVLEVIRPKFEAQLTLDHSVDAEKRVDEIDIHAADWRRVLDEFAEKLNLHVIETDGGLLLSTQQEPE